MKNTIKLLDVMRSITIIALVAIIGFSMAACSGGGGGSDDGGGSGGSGGGGGGGGGGSGYLTIIGLPSGQYSVRVFSSSKSIPNADAAVSFDYLASGVNGSDAFGLFVKDTSTEWKGSGSFQVVLIKRDNTYQKATVSFTNGSATVNYSAFTVLD